MSCHITTFSPQDNTLPASGQTASRAAKRRAEDAKSLADSFKLLSGATSGITLALPAGGTVSKAPAAASSSAAPVAPRVLLPNRNAEQHADGLLTGTRRIMLIGPTGHGKSSLVNSLLGEEMATTAGSGSAVTCAPSEFYFWKGGTFVPREQQEELAVPGGSSSSQAQQHEAELPPAPTRCENSGASTPAALLQSLLQNQRVPRSAKISLPRYKVTLRFLSEEQWFKELQEEIEEFMEKKRSPLLRKVYKGEEINNLLERWANKKVNLDNELDCEQFRTNMEREVKTLHARLRNNGGGFFGFGGAPRNGRLNMNKPEDKRPCEMLGQTHEQIVWSLEPLKKVEKCLKEVIERIEVGSDFPLLRVPGFADGAVRLGDVPGFGDSSGFRERIAQRCLEGAQKILICSNSARAGSDKQVLEYLRKDAVKSLQMKMAGKNCIVFVATKSDQAKLSEMARGGGAAASSSAGDLVELSSDSDDDNFNGGGSTARLHKKNRQKRQDNQNTVRSHVRDMVAMEHFGRMPVCVVSSERYMALKGLKQDESAAAEMDEELTEIPALAVYLMRSLYAECAMEHLKKLEGVLVHCASIRVRAEQNNKEQDAALSERAGDFVKKVSCGGAQLW